MNIVVFEDKQVSTLDPITTGKPAYAVTCGGYRLIDWLRQIQAKLSGLVRPHLATVQLLDFEDLATFDPTDEWTLLVNARLVPSRSNYVQLERLSKQNEACIVRADFSIAAALLPTCELGGDLNQATLSSIENYFTNNNIAANDGQLAVIDYPHDIVRAHLECFSENLQHRIDAGTFQEVKDGLFVGSGVDLDEGLVVDASEGPVLIDENTQVGPHCFMSGPVYIGPNSRIIEHSSIKDQVCISHTCKIGGEVEASIIEAYSNKQHHGFLGHSYVGNWVNLGAGTCNSDLKNTYGEVKMDYGGTRISTGMQFIGCIVGDYAKSAINTSIFTGKTIGVCSMLYGFVTTNVPSFVNYARSFGQVTEMPPAVMVSTQKRMFERRKVQQRPCDIQLINDMYELTRAERQIAGEPLSL